MENKEVIKQLIRNGFDIESISFEFDVPREEVKKLQEEVQTQRDKDITKKGEPSKMEILRQRYNELYWGDNTIQIEQVRELSPEERELVDLTIKKIEEETIKMQGLHAKERKSIAYQIMREIDKIKQYALDIQQIEKICQLLQAEEMQKFNTYPGDKLDSNFAKIRREMVIKLLEAINIAQAQTESIEELKDLERKLSTGIIKKYQTLANSVNTRISNKITNLVKQKAINKMRNTIPIRIQAIIANIANGTLNVVEARQVIEQEADQQMQNNLNNKFSLTREQQKNKIYMQIRDRLIEQSEEYVIQNPETAITRITRIMWRKFTTSY